jgi:hypothetical protein
MTRHELTKLDRIMWVSIIAITVVFWAVAAVHVASNFNAPATEYKVTSNG